MRSSIEGIFLESLSSINLFKLLLKESGRKIFNKKCSGSLQLSTQCLSKTN